MFVSVAVLFTIPLPLIACNIPQVFITISSLAIPKIFSHWSDTTVRQVQLNWCNATPNTGDWVGLFTSDPTNTNISQPVIKHAINNQSQGVFTTNYTLEYPNFYENLQRSCIDYWIAYISSNNILASNCFRIEPDWMWENRDDIGNQTFRDIMIPGTHDSGAFKAYSGLKSENPYFEYVFTQDEDFWSQMVYGIRHFDIRMGYDQKTNQFYLIHMFNCNPFLPQLISIRKFVESRNEFLILDFHAFGVGFHDPNVTTQRHDQFVALLASELGNLIIPKSVGYDVTFNELWDTPYRVLICYNDEFHNTSDLLWPGVQQLWADTLDENTLRVYFENVFNDSSKIPQDAIWSAQAELTAHVKKMIKHPFKGLRKMADRVNLNLTYWFKDLWWQSANIVATDYFHGNNIIEVSILANRRRSNSFL